MATLLLDTFTGSGSLVGHSPDTPYGGQTWAVTAGSGVNLTSGKAVPVDAFGTSIEYGAAATNYGLSGNFTMTFVVVTTASFLATGDGETAFSVRLRSVAGNVTAFSVAKDFGVWTLSNGTTQTNISPANSTSYTGVLTMTNGVASCTFMGATVNDPIPGGVFASLSNLYFYLASCTPLDSVLVEGPTTGSSGLVLPHITASATNVAPATAAGAITLPRLGLSSAPNGYAKTPLALPRLSAYATAHDSTGDRAADITLPSLTVTIRTGANAAASLPELGVQAAGTGTLMAQVAANLPSLSASATGTVAAVGDADISLPSFGASSYAGALCSVTLGEVTLQASGTANGVGSAQITLPLFDATATATAQTRGGLNIVLPSLGLRSGGNGARASLPGLQLTAIGTAVIAVSYEAYAVNLGHLPRVTNQEMPVDEVTHYTNFPFTHVVRYKGSYYGANSTGLYLLEGTTDSGTPIPFAVKTCETDFDKPEHKTVESVYFAGRIGNAETVTLFAREETTHVQTFTTPRNTKPQSHRQMFARGLKSRYFALGLSGSKEFELDTIDLSVGTTKRRI